MTIGQSLTSAAWAYKNGLYQAAQTVMPAGTYVCLGDPQTLDPSSIVSIAMLTSHQTVAAMSTNREREETLTCEVVISTYQGGMGDAENAVVQSAYNLAALLEKQVHYIQNGTDGSLLGGVVRECFMVELREDTSLSTVNESTGRECALLATFQGKARIRWNP